MASAEETEVFGEKTSPSRAYNKSKEFWAQKEALSSEQESTSPRLPSRSSSRSLLTKNSISNITPIPSAPSTPLITSSSSSEKKEKRKSSRHDSSSRKSRTRDTISPSASTITSDNETIEPTIYESKPSKREKIETISGQDSEPTEVLKVLSTSKLSTPVTSRSNSDTSLSVLKLAPIPIASNLSPVSTPSRKRASSSRSSHSVRVSSDSPIRLRIGPEDKGDWPSSVSAISSSSDIIAPSPKKPSRTVSSEIHLLKHELERERSDRLILEAIVLEHQKLIETLSSKLDRQSKIILSLQQSVEMFSRPQRIGSGSGGTPPPSKELMERKLAMSSMVDSAASKEDDEDELAAIVGGPRKSKSARALTQSSSIQRVDSPSSSSSSSSNISKHQLVLHHQQPSDINGMLAFSIDSNRQSPTPASPVSFADDVVVSSSNANRTKSNRRKSKSSKDLPVILDSSPIRSRMTSDASSSSVGSDTVSSRSKRDKEISSSKDIPIIESPPPLSSSSKEKEGKDKERRKSSRKSMIVVLDTNSTDIIPRSPTPQVGIAPNESGNSKSSEYGSSSSPSIMLGYGTTPITSPRDSVIIDSKKEKRKSKRSLTPSVDDPQPLTSVSSPSFKSDTSISTTPTIHFNTSPSIIPVSSPSSSSSSFKRVKMSTSQKKSSTLRGVGAKKDAMTDVEDYTVEKKRRKVRRTLSDPDDPSSSSAAAPQVAEDIIPVSKMKSKSKRKSERASSIERHGTGEVSLVLSSEKVGSSGGYRSSNEKSDRKEKDKSSTSTSERRKSEKSRRKSSSSPMRAVNPTSTSSGSVEKKKYVRLEGVRRDSSASDSFEPLTAEAAHEADSAPKSAQHIVSPHKLLMNHSNFRQTSRKLEMEEEKIQSAKRREVTSPRTSMVLDLDRSALRDYHNSKMPSPRDASQSPNTESAELSRSGAFPPSASSAAAAVGTSNNLTISIGGGSSLNGSAEMIPPLSLDLSSSANMPSGQARAQFEQERDSREATMLSPRGRELSGIGVTSSSAAPLTSRSHALHFLSTLPSNEIGIPIILEQLCQYLTAEGTSLVALFEKRVDFARLENLRRKLDQTLSCASPTNTKTLSASVAKDLKGEDAYVVAGVLKRWFLDLPDTLLMMSKTRYWLDVVEITDQELCIAGLQTLYYSLDLNRRRVLRYVIDFLKNFIVVSGGVTTLDDVCTRFGPLLMRVSGSANTTRGESSPHRELSGIQQMIHSNSSSNLSGSTDDVSPISKIESAAITTNMNGSTGVEKSAPVTSNSSSTIAIHSTSAAHQAGKISRRGSARLEVDSSAENQLLMITLMKYLITRDSEIIKNHDQGVEFSRRPDLNYVVRCATSPKILMLLIDQNYTEREFSQIVWDTCIYFTKPTELLTQFIELYKKANGDLKWQNRIRMRILMAIKTWVKHSNFALGPNKEFRSTLQQFSNEVMQEMQSKDAGVISNQEPLAASTAAGSAGAEARILHSIMNASMFERSDDTWIQWKLQRLSACEPFTFEVQKHDPSIIAGQLAMIHCRLFSMIHPSELTYNAPLDAERSPNYTGVVQHINCLTSWVAYDILYRTTPADRARVLVYYLDVAECSLNLGDFLGCWAIRGAFDLHPVSRMSQTLERIPRKDASRNKRLASLFEPRMNFAEYRRAFDNQLNETSFAIPILAFLPKDIIRLETSEPTFPEPGLVDVDKLRSIYYVLQNLTYADAQAFLKLNPQIKAISTIWDFFANLPLIQETTLDQLSYKAEPRLTVPQNSRRITSASATSPSRSQTER
jgi:hypothetical protein